MAKPGKSSGNDPAMAYIREIDRFATMLRDQQVEIDKLTAFANSAKATYDSAKEAVREAREIEHNTVSLLLKFIRPGSIEIMPLFDQMEPTDEAAHSEHSTEWRKEPISVLGLSALAARALIDKDVVLVGQLQDLILKGPSWSTELELTPGVAAAIEMKLYEFIEERTGR